MPATVENESCCCEAAIWPIEGVAEWQVALNRVTIAGVVKSDILQTVPSKTRPGGLAGQLKA
jgi:hypothetical protein